jgi:Fe-S oxidoreductase
VLDFKEECTGCGAVCTFLAEYGTPDLILAERPEASFYCTSCRRCDAVCPRDLSPAAAFFAAKEQLVQEDQLPTNVRKVLDGARGFAKAGQGFPFTFYESKDTVFWPGCGLAANRPGLVREVRKILSRRLQKQVWLVLDCCYDPVYGLGDTATAGAALQNINKRLRNGGVTKVITGCLNCYKLLSQHLEGIEVVFILELLPPDLFEKHWAGPAYLHHPCPATPWKGIRGAATGLFNDIGNAATSARAASLRGMDQKSAPLARGLP